MKAEKSWSHLGYPHNTQCMWEFRVKPEKVESVSVVCDHMHLIGNYFQDCEDGDFFVVTHKNNFNDDWDKLCGDLSDWMPMNTTIPIDFESHAEQRYLIRIKVRLSLKITELRTLWSKSSRYNFEVKELMPTNLI